MVKSYLFYRPDLSFFSLSLSFFNTDVALKPDDVRLIHYVTKGCSRTYPQEGATKCFCPKGRGNPKLICSGGGGEVKF